MPRGETGKQRQTRIELGYYKRPDAIARWRAKLIVIAIVLAGLWFGLAPMWDRGPAVPVRLFEWDRLASPGPLARAHSTWESRCEACHVPFRSVSAVRPASVASAVNRAGDLHCQTCHTGPPHHPALNAGEVFACAECHRDHRGQEASLVRMADFACTGCHADLKNHGGGMPTSNAPTVSSAVTHFDANPIHHPEFAPIGRADPGRLRFNHALHQSTGFTREPGGKPFTFAQVAENERSRYGWTAPQKLDSAVPPLEHCSACHALDKTDFGSSTARTDFTSRGAEAYMVPVTYENHCRGCHPLAFDPKNPGKRLRHGLSPREALDELRQYYSAQAVEADPDRLRQFIAPRRKPGEPASPPGLKFVTAIDDKVMTALKILFGSSADDNTTILNKPPTGRGGCVECHQLSPAPDPFVHTNAIENVAIVPTNVKRVWYQHAVFNHAAHRALECVACHSQARTSEKSTDVLLPGITNCVHCHGPAAGRKSDARGGAGDSCTECHRYHGGGQSQGPNVLPRGETTRMSIESFLGGNENATSTVPTK